MTPKMALRNPLFPVTLVETEQWDTDAAALRVLQQTGTCNCHVSAQCSSQLMVKLGVAQTFVTQDCYSQQHLPVHESGRQPLPI